MKDLLIHVNYTAAPIPTRELDYAAYVDGQEEDGACTGATPWEALRDLADRLEMEAEEAARPECPACREPKYGDPCSLCEARRSDVYVTAQLNDLVEIGRQAVAMWRFGHYPQYATCDALDLLACESLLEAS